MARRRRRKLTASALLVVMLLLLAQALLRDEGATRVGAAPDGAAVTDPSSPAVESLETAAQLLPGERRGPYPVRRVIDGDTIHVEIASSVTPLEKVRLLRINTPERDEPGYERAAAALKALLEGREVHLVFERPNHAERDDYGRLLAYVFLGDVNVNVELVRRGFTPFFTKYGEGRFAAAFHSAESHARSTLTGLWTADGWNPHEQPDAPAPRRR